MSTQTTNLNNAPNQPHDDIDDYITLSQRVFPSEKAHCPELDDLQKDLQTKLSQFGEHSPEVLEIYSKLAELHLTKNQYQDALKYLQLHYDIKHKKADGLKDIDRNVLQLAVVQTLLGDFTNAKLHLDECFKTWNTEPSGDIVHRIKLQKAKIRFLMHQGEYSAAFKEIHPQNPIVNFEKNMTHTDKMELALLEARVLARQSEIYRMNEIIDYVLGEVGKQEKGELDKRIYPEIWNTLGSLYQFKGKYEQAKEYYKLSLKSGLNAGSENLLLVADTYTRLSDVYMIDGYYAQSFKILEESNRISQTVLPEVHTQNSTYYANLGKWYTSQCDFKNAKETLGIALDLRLKIFGKDHPLIVDVYQKLGEYHIVTTEFKLAIEDFEKALQVEVERPSELPHYDDAVSYNGQGKAMFLMQDYLEARKKFEKSLKIMTDLFKEDHALVADYYGNLSITYGACRDSATHLKYVKKALGIQKKMLGKNHPKTAPAYQSLSLIYGKQGDYEKALKKTYKAVSLREKFYGKYHPYVGETYLRLGMLYRSKGDYAEAIKHFMFSLEINLRFYLVSNPKNGPIMSNLTFLFEKIKNFREAEKYRKMLYLVKKEAKGSTFGSALDSLIDSSLCRYEIS